MLRILGPALVIAVATSGCDVVDCFDDGELEDAYRDGRRAGEAVSADEYERGRAQGLSLDRAVGVSEGQAAGYDDGYQSGYSGSTGYAAGYDQGHPAGWNDGLLLRQSAATAGTRHPA